MDLGLFLICFVIFHPQFKPMKEESILVTGAGGQIGTELVEALSKRYEKVYPADIRLPNHPTKNFIQLDVLDKPRMEEAISDLKISQVYHLAAILSAKGEQNPMLAWEVNFKGTLNVLEIAAEKKLNRVFCPSSIAVFGPNTPSVNTPQHTITDPTTIYGVTKLAGERWCVHYFQKRGVDVRSLRYPGLIGYKTMPGGGTTDYAVEIFHEALKNNHYTSYIAPDTRMPMMFMPDAIRATLNLMEAPTEQITIRSSYNVAGVNFTPRELSAAIKKQLPDFNIDYQPDFRDLIAQSWPSSLDDSAAANDWGWKPAYDLEKMVKEMLLQLQAKLV